MKRIAVHLYLPGDENQSFVDLATAQQAARDDVIALPLFGLAHLRRQIQWLHSRGKSVKEVVIDTHQSDLGMQTGPVGILENGKIDREFLDIGIKRSHSFVYKNLSEFLSILSTLGDCDRVQFVSCGMADEATRGVLADVARAADCPAAGGTNATKPSWRFYPMPIYLGDEYTAYPPSDYDRFVASIFGFQAQGQVRLTRAYLDRRQGPPLPGTETYDPYAPGSVGQWVYPSYPFYPLERK